MTLAHPKKTTQPNYACSGSCFNGSKSKYLKLFEIQATISSLVHGVKQFAHLQKARDFIRHETSGEESYIDRRCPDLKKRSKKGKAG